MADIIYKVMELNNKVFEIMNKAYDLDRTEHICMSHNGANTFPESTAKEIYSILEGTKDVALEMVDFMNEHEEHTFLVYDVYMKFLGKYERLSNKEGIVCNSKFVTIDKIGAISIEGRISYSTVDELVNSVMESLRSRIRNMPYLKISEISKEINKTYYYDKLKLEF